MTKERLKFQNGHKKEVYDTFIRLLDESEHDLNQVVGTDSFIIPADMSEDFAHKLNKFLGLIKNAYHEEPDILNMFDEFAKEKNCDKFIDMIKRYIDAIRRPARETAFLRNLLIDDFEEMVKYCYLNYIIENCDIEKDESKWKLEQLRILRKVIFTVAEMVVLHNYPKQRVLSQIGMTFEFGNEYIDILLNTIKGDEERLWRYLIVLKSGRMEKKMDLLLDLLQN